LIAPCGELGLEEAMDLSQDRLRDEWLRNTPNTHVHTAWAEYRISYCYSRWCA